MTETTLDAIVIGAGIAGLTAARELTQAGAAAAVIEARDRVGGRTLSREAGGQWVDLGGQWIGPGQHRMARLARDLGVPTFPTYATGRKVMEIRGKVRTYEGSPPALSPVNLLFLNTVMDHIEKLRARVPPDQPWSADGAEELDTMTLATWERRTIPTRTVREVLDAATRIVFGAEPGELSLLHFLFHTNAAGGLMHLIEARGGAQQERFVHGAQAVSRRLAEGLSDDRLTLAAPVRRIEQDSSGVTVRTDQGSYRARYAIVAVPPALAGRINYEPALPARRDGLTQRLCMGATIKCIAFYETPFWRRRGYSGEAISSGGPVTAVLDNSPPDGSGGALVAFVVGRHAREWGARSRGSRRTAVLGALARFFGPLAAEPIEYLEMDWSAEPFTRGCPTGTMPPSTMTLFGPALREPVGRLHWAGTETATHYAGYMEGAVESGERAAREVLGRL